MANTDFADDDFVEGPAPAQAPQSHAPPPAAALSDDDFVAGPPPGDWGGYLSTAGREFAKGAVTGAGEIVGGIPERAVPLIAGALVPGVGQAAGLAASYLMPKTAPDERGLPERAGKAVKDWASTAIPTTKTEDESLTGQVAHGIGSMAAPMAVGAVTGPIGAAAAFGLQGANEQSEAAREHGASEADREKAAALGFALNAAGGLIPFHAILKPIERSAPGIMDWAVTRLKKAVVDGMIFTTAGEAQDWVGQQIAKAYYDPNAGYSFDFRRALGSYITGGLLGQLHRAKFTPSAAEDQSAKSTGAESTGETTRATSATGEPDYVAELSRILGRPPTQAEVEAKQEQASAARPPAESESILAPSPGDEGGYVDQAMRNLAATSRTAAGTLDVSNAPGKEKQLVEGLTAEQAKAAAVNNYAGVIRDLYRGRNEVPSTGHGMGQFIDAVAERVNNGIVKPGELARANQTKIAYQTKPEDLAAAHAQFSQELARRLADPNADPVETAAWIEWRANIIDHFWSDGVGKTSKALAAIPLMRAGLPLPVYPPNKDFFALAKNEKPIDPNAGGMAYLTPGWEHFNAFYHQMVDPRRTLQAMIDAGASPEELAKHPLVLAQMDRQKKTVPTGTEADFTNPDWQAQRVYQFGNDRVEGWDNAVNRLIDDAVAFAGPDGVGQDKRAVIILGPPAAGKSTVAEPLAREYRGALIDPDEAKKAIPEYQGGLGTSAVHEESSHLAKEVLKRIARNGFNLILPKVGQEEGSIRKWIDALKGLGYTVDLVHVSTHDANISARRNFQRFLKTGRLVDPKYVAEIGDKPRRVSYILRGEANDFADIDTGHRAEVTDGDGPLADALRTRLLVGGLGRPERTPGRALQGQPVTGIQPHRVTSADGRSVEVRPIVVEASSLITSQDHGYDRALQPRQRTRAASQQQVRDIATNLDPERLGYSSEADRGAPIVGPDSMVESGNGRVLALRSVYERGGDQAQAYRDWVAKQGVDVSGFREPVLVRERTTELSPEERRDFTVASNQAATLAMSAPERALADAGHVDADSLALIHNADDLAAAVNRPFMRRFVASLPQAEQGSFVDAQGRLSAEGLARVRNAILAKAYGDAATLSRIAESTNDEVKSISNALVAAAPQWARLRAEIEAGNVRPDMDVTPQLLEAVSRTADLRAQGIKIDEFLAQLDAFDKPAPEVEHFMRSFYHPITRRAAVAARITDALRWYAQEAGKVTNDKGLNLGLAPIDTEQVTRLMRETKEREDELSYRGRAGDVAHDEAGSREVRGPGLGAAGEGARRRGDLGFEEGAIRAQQPTLEELDRLRGVEDPYKPVRTFPGEEGTEARIYKNADGKRFNVTLYDRDSGQTLNTVTIHPTLEAAEKKARALAEMPAGEHWWEHELTQMGRAAALHEVGIGARPGTAWRHLRPDVQQRLIDARNKAGFAAMVAQNKADRAAVRGEIERGLKEEGSFAVPSYNGGNWLLTPATARDKTPYRITFFDKAGDPTGHFEVRDLDEAAKEMVGHWKKAQKPAPKTEPIGRQVALADFARKSADRYAAAAQKLKENPNDKWLGENLPNIWKSMVMDELAYVREFEPARVKEIQNTLDRAAGIHVPKTEPIELAKGQKGEQFVIPGAEKISTAELLRRKSAEPMRASIPQEIPGGLFGDLLGQEELFRNVNDVSEQQLRERPARETPAAVVASTPRATAQEGIGRQQEGVANVAAAQAGEARPPDLTSRPAVPNSATDLFGEAPSARSTRPARGGVRPGTQEVPGGEQPKRPIPAKRPNQLSLFGGEPSGGQVGAPDGGVQPPAGSPEVAGTGPSESVTKPPARSRGTDPARPDLPTPTRAGIREAEQKIAERSRSNYRITDEDRLGEGGPKVKVRQNIDAIRLLKAIEDEGREATPGEKAVLVKYTGWGAFSQAIFDEYKVRPEWEAERAALRALMTDEEWNAARHSTQNAHYTSPDVIRGMWDALSHLGYDGGTALEPAAGVGHFIGLIPDAVAPRTAWTGVELDPLTGRIAKALYGGAEMNVHGFEDLKRPSNYYDLAISNVPFGDIPIREKPYGAFKQIHDFFFVKSLDKVRPGGVVAFVTSKGTMDKAGTRIRERLAKDADLVGAIRLPGGDKGAFAKNAGTQVTTDIIFLRKKIPGEKPFPGAKWLETKEVQTPEGPTYINEYFADNPKMMLGEMRLLGSMYRENEPVLIGDPAGLQQKIADAARSMQAGALAPRIEPATLENLPATDTVGVKDGGFFLKDGQMYRRVAGEGIPHPMSADDHDRVTRFMGMRDLYDKILDAQITGRDAEPDRAKLRAAYKAFVDKYGPINKEETTVTSRKNKEGEPIVISRMPNFRAFRRDPDAWKVSSIENYDAEKGTAKPADIQTKDVLRAPPTREINGPGDALAAALNDTGRVDLDHVAQSLGVADIDQAAGALGDLIYQDPNGRQWKTADDYLSGNVVQKLEEAREIAKSEPLYLRNVAALEKVQPLPIPPGPDITTSFGTPWVPADVYTDFVKEVLGGTGVDLSMSPQTGEWFVKVEHFPSDMRAKYGVAEGHGGKIEKILKAALNNQKVTVRDTVKDEDGNYPVLAKQTEEANNKVALMREAFSGDPEFGIDGWVWQDPERGERLAGIYNRQFNNLANRQFDGSHLTFPGLNPKFSDRQHRKDAVWRVLQQGNTLLAHEVGSGKTVTMIAAGMEQKRLGLIQKPAYVVPNHMLEQFSREFIEAYPNAKILVASKEEMSADQRKAFIAKAAANNWDGVVITHDAFGRINVNRDTRRAHIDEQVEQLNQMIDEEVEAGEKKSRTVKDLERSRDKLTDKLKELMNEERKDEGLNFEDTGIDFLFVDEAHLFKNLSFLTRNARVKGLGQGDAQRAEDLFLKMRSLEQNRPGRSAVFATGTPVSNTMAELWTMMRYLELDKLKERGLDNFDRWANTFGKIQTRVELGADGRTLEDVTSFSKFVNVPELVALYSEIADTKTAEMLNLPRPEVKTRSGAPGIEIVKAQPSSAEEAAIQKLVDEAKHMKENPKRPEKGDRIMLNVVTDGRKVATDMRLLDPTADFNPQGKVAKAVENIARIYQEGNKDPDAPNKVQMVFLDMGVPLKKGGEDKIDLYGDMKKRLVDAGVPAKEIGFIHDADNDIKKARLFKDVRAGKIRVLFGSTGKMGVGTNVQDRLIAMHHIDAPWKPAEVTQRDGRIVRQGNMNKAVQLYRYVTEHSFDAFMWQKLDTKAKFIAQVLSGTKGSRVAEDADSPLPEAEEMKAAASGDPRIIEHAELDRTVRGLSSQRRTFESTQARASQDIASAKQRIANYDEALPNARDDAEMVNDTYGDKFSVDLGDKGIMNDRKAAGEAVLAGLTQLDPRQYYRPAVVKIGMLSGFDMNMEIRGGWGGGTETILRATPSLKGKAGYGAANDIVINPHTDAAGLMMRYERILRSIKQEPERLEGLLKNERANVDRLEKTLGEKWPKEKEYKAALAKLSELGDALKAKKHPDVQTDEVQAQRPQIETPEFKRWFGDSEVVGDNGRPLVVYHGTRGSRRDFRPLSHFGTSDAAADRLEQTRDKRGAAGENVVPVYLSIKNAAWLYEDPGLGKPWDLAQIAVDKNGKRIFTPEEIQDFAHADADVGAFIDAIKAKGYDGFSYQNEREDPGSLSYIVLDGRQVKSAIGNRGTFDPEDADIRAKRGEPGEAGAPAGRRIELSKGAYAYVSPEYTAAEKKIATAVQEIAQRMAPQATVQGAKALRLNGQRLWGAFVDSRQFPHFIAWSLERGNAAGAAHTVRHEIIHHLKKAGLFKPAEWEALSKAAKDNGWLDKYDINWRYPHLDEGKKIEEAIAEHFAGWRTERGIEKAGLIRDAFHRLDLLMKRVAAAARRYLGAKATPDDVLTRIETGEVGARRSEQIEARKEAGEGVAASRAPGFYFDAEKSPLYAKRTAAEVGLLTPEKARAALETDATARRIMAKNIKVNDGDMIGARLNLNVMKKTGVPVQALHKGNKGEGYKANRGFWNGEVLGYEPVVTLKDAYLNVHQPARESIARGEAKAPMASVDGKYSPGAHSFDGVEFRFNPKREHLFVDKLGRVLRHADEVTIHGNSVFARGHIEYYGKEDVPPRAGEAPSRGRLIEPGVGGDEDIRGQAGEGEVQAQTPEREARERRQALVAAAGGPQTVWGRLVNAGDKLRGASQRFSEHLGLDPLVTSMQNRISPMASRTGTPEARAIATDYMIAMRAAMHRWQEAAKYLTDKFTPEQLEKMWNAADEESVALQQNRTTQGIGLDRLTPGERSVVQFFQGVSEDLFKQAQDLGMIQGEGLPSYVPRILVRMAETGKFERGIGPDAKIVRDFRTLAYANMKLERAIAARRLVEQIREIGEKTGNQTVSTGSIPHPKGADAMVEHAINIGFGKGFSDTTANLKHRKYLTAAETEAAARRAPKEDKDAPKWVTIANSAFQIWRPKMIPAETEAIRNAYKAKTGTEMGKVVAEDNDGNPLWEKVPIYVRDDFAEPLRAVLEQESGPVTQALMSLKGKIMSVVMFSPLIHNQVEWGRAIPAAPGKVLTAQIYFDGNQAKNDPVMMQRFIGARGVPIGGHGFMMDISELGDAQNLEPGAKSWVTQGVGYGTKMLGQLTHIYDPEAGSKTVKRALDKAGNFWHNTLLWDRVADLQMGLFKTVTEDMQRKGHDQRTADLVAAHFANRYAGALPVESMSRAARNIANLLLFSRSFTLGNVATYKDAVAGLPRDVQALILRDVGPDALAQAQSFTKKKSRAMLALDAGLYYTMISLMQSAFHVAGAATTMSSLGGATIGSMVGAKFGGRYGALLGAPIGAAGGWGAAALLGAQAGPRTLQEEIDGYWDRFTRLLTRGREHPFQTMFNPLGALTSLLSTAENEPGLEGRMLWGYDKDGRAQYMRLPVGKVTEELMDWFGAPNDILHRKLSTFARPLNAIWSNDIGFGRKLYDPNADTPAERAQNIYRIAAAIAWNQVPVDMLKSARDMIVGPDRADAASKLVSQMTGFTFRQGHPEGPAAGFARHIKDKHDFLVQEAMPAIKEKIRKGDYDGAQADMEKVQMPKGLQDWYLRRGMSGATMSRKTIKDFFGFATDEQADEFARRQEQEDQDKERLHAAGHATGGAVQPEDMGPESDTDRIKGAFDALDRQQRNNPNLSVPYAPPADLRGRVIRPGSTPWGSYGKRVERADGGSVGDDTDYDMAAATAAGVQPDENGHWPDTYKRPTHITFSDESIYHGPENPGGHWERVQGDEWNFTPGAANLRHHSAEELQDYFQRYEPKSHLVLPAKRAHGGRTKVSKVSVNYRDGTPEKHCGNCSMYEAHKCTLVAGPINPKKLCDDWDPMAPARAHGGRVDHRNIETEPTEAQKTAGNYAHDHLHWNGLPLTIENAKGSFRSGIGKDGKRWRTRLPAHYGYVKRTEGADGDHLDIFLGPHRKAPNVFVVDQKDAHTGRFDEHKALMGFGSAAQALNTYCKAFSDGCGKDRVGHLTTMPLALFKEWVKNHDTTKPLGMGA